MAKDKPSLFTEVEDAVLRRVANGGAQPLDRLLTGIEGNPLGAVRHLMSEGYLELVAYNYPWGIGYTLALTSAAKRYLEGDGAPEPEVAEEIRIVEAREAERPIRPTIVSMWKRIEELYGTQ